VCPVEEQKQTLCRNGFDVKSNAIKTIVEQVSDECKLCGKCVDECPGGARQFVGVEFSPRQLIQEILKDRMFFEESNGGVTFSGGEPLAQPEFLIESLKLLKEQGIHTAVDTCGFAPPEFLIEAAKETDLFLFDIKFISPELHRIYTGERNELIIENLTLLGKIHNNIWIRIPVIQDVNTDEREISAIAGFIKSLRSVRQINLLPYHKNGVAKGKRINRNAKPVEFETPSDAVITRLKDILSTANLPVIIGG